MAVFPPYPYPYAPLWIIVLSFFLPPLLILICETVVFRLFVRKNIFLLFLWAIVINLTSLIIREIVLFITGWIPVLGHGYGWRQPDVYLTLFVVVLVELPLVYWLVTRNWRQAVLIALIANLISFAVGTTASELFTRAKISLNAANRPAQIEPDRLSKDVIVD